jgi:hypothetical protein
MIHHSTQHHFFTLLHLHTVLSLPPALTSLTILYTFITVHTYTLASSPTCDHPLCLYTAASTTASTAVSIHCCVLPPHYSCILTALPRHPAKTCTHISFSQHHLHRFSSYHQCITHLPKHLHSPTHSPHMLTSCLFFLSHIF